MLFTTTATAVRVMDEAVSIFSVVFDQSITDPTKFDEVKLIKKKVDDATPSVTVLDYKGGYDTHEMAMFARETIRAEANTNGFYIISMFTIGSTFTDAQRRGIRNTIEGNPFVAPLTEIHQKKKAFDGFDPQVFIDIDDEAERAEAITKYITDSGLMADPKSEKGKKALKETGKAMARAMQIHKDGGSQEEATGIMEEHIGVLKKMVKDSPIDLGAMVEARSVIVTPEDTEETIHEQMRAKGMPEDIAREVAKMAIKNRPAEQTTDDAGESMARVQKYADMIRDTREKYGDESARRLARSTYQRTKDDALLTAEALVFGADKPKRKSK